MRLLVIEDDPDHNRQLATALTDALSPNLVISKLISESIAASDSLHASAIFAAAISEATALTDGLQVRMVVSVSLLESILATDSVLATAILNAEVTEVLILEDELLAGLVYNETISEAIALSDFVVASVEPQGDGVLLRLRRRNTTLQPDARNVILSPKSRKNLI